MRHATLSFDNTPVCLPTPTTSMLQDLSSLSNPNQIGINHLDWTVVVDFEQQIFRASATYTLQRFDQNCTELWLDTAQLSITSVTAGSHHDKPLLYKLAAASKSHLGSQLVITLPPVTTSAMGDEDKSLLQVTIQYKTTAQSSAIQWLPPSQTAGQKYPYLFTQSQAIHGRSMIPCMDQPGVKFTWQARVQVPDWAVVVMSGLLLPDDEGQTMLTPSQSVANPSTTSTATGDVKWYYWKQPVPVSSYLVAMAVGELVRRDISPRCAVWSEPKLIDVVAYEFAQMDEFLQHAETIAGQTPYVWGRYDVLCLPPSFPYGGMENPCLTFVTPTLLARDRSLADVVAHEIAHSWTGNLVTNATWEHFWLNEGWTKWFERKIMSRIHGQSSEPNSLRQYFEFDAIGGYKDLRDAISELPERFQKLVLPIGDGDPDESYSTVAYEKGFNLLYALERRVGTHHFEQFFKAYLAQYAGKTITSEEFKSYFEQYFRREGFTESIQNIPWDSWYYDPGMPPEEPSFDRTLVEASEHLAHEWFTSDGYSESPSSVPTTNIVSWSSKQKTCFLDCLQVLTSNRPLQRRTLKAMDDQYRFSESQNAEILFRFCEMSIASEDESMLLVILHFITSQGRMKFVRPLYRALYQSKMGKEIALAAFVRNKDFYHPICAKMIASDLQMTATIKRKPDRLSWSWWHWISITGILATAAFAVTSMRRKRHH